MSETSGDPTGADRAGPTTGPHPSRKRPDQVDEPVEEQAPLLTLRDGLPLVVETEPALSAFCDLLAAGSGPVAIDAERASGYKYSNRAYLVQLRREGAGTALVDPIAFESLEPLARALEGTEWILHAATQDLPCLAEVGLRPAALFDTELAGRLLGKPRVGLATLVEELVGQRMRKEHSAADWSTRPLPASWLEYAALDVEVLLELREAMVEELAAAGKTEWARQEFEALLSFEPTVREEAWRRTSGAHKLRGRRAQGAVRALWEARDRIARERDVAPGRIIPDSAIIAAAAAMPSDRARPARRPGVPRPRCRALRPRLDRRPRLHPRRPRVGAARASGAQRRPARSHAPGPSATPSPPAASPTRASAIAALSEKHQVPVENLLTPDYLRRVLWTPPGLPRATASSPARWAGSCAPSAPASGRSSSPAPPSSRRSSPPTPHRGRDAADPPAATPTDSD